MSFFNRFASRTVQKAHARVTAENAHYVREAIRQDATIERLTQERDQALARIAELAEQLALTQRGGVSLARTAKAYHVAVEADIARLKRRWDGHAAVCEVAAALDDEDLAKATTLEQS